MRHIGLTVLINNEEYWFKNRINDNDLIIKSTSESITGNTFTNIELTNDLIIYEPFIGEPVFFEKEDYVTVLSDQTVSYREIFFRRLDGEQATLKIQWIAKMFYGNEYYD